MNNISNLIIIAVIIVIVGLAAFYIYKSKKAGKKCIGCPYSGTCGKNTQESCCSCHTQNE